MSNQSQSPDPKDCTPSFAEAVLAADAVSEYMPGKQLSMLQGNPVIDWNYELANPPGPSDNKSWDRLEAAAGSWVSCACGNLCSIIPRGELGKPTDFKLAMLGNQFYEYIGRRDIQNSLEYLEEIEKRSTVLIQRIYDSQGNGESTPETK